jgi:hypothetical protein
VEGSACSAVSAVRASLQDGANEVLLMCVLRQGMSCVMLPLSLPQREVMLLWHALRGAQRVTLAEYITRHKEAATRAEKQQL